MNTRRAFTLMELLAVIAIIAVLAGILFPVFTRTKETSQKTVSGQQMRQLGLALNMYTDEYDHKLPMSTNYAQSEASPDRLWTNTLMPFVKSEKVFVAPGTEGIFAKTWEDRGRATVGYNSSTAYDPQKGCADDASDVPCAGFRHVATFDKDENPSVCALFAVTPGGPVSENYLGYEFSPYNGTINPDNPKMSPPMVSDRDLVKELGDTLTADLLKPIHARYLRTGSDDGITPIIFGDGHVKEFSAKKIAALNSGIVWRLQ